MAIVGCHVTEGLKVLGDPRAPSVENGTTAEFWTRFRVCWVLAKAMNFFKLP